MFAKKQEMPSFLRNSEDINRFDFKGEKGVRAEGCLYNF